MLEIQLTMNCRSVCLSIFLFLIKQSIEQDIRLCRMSKITNSKFQCANTTCLPFVTNIVPNIGNCKTNCLAQTYCRAISFHQLTSTCQLFDNIPNPNGNMLFDANTITMIVIAGTRNPPG